MKYISARWLRWSLGVLSFFVFGQIFTPISAHTNRPGILYWRGDPQQRWVALTFDDGPNEPYTSEILKVLRHNNVRATFFMMGKNVEAFPDTARAVAQEGHAIGNHSYSHADLVLDTNAGVRQEILKTQDVLERVVGHRPILFRPPYGSKDYFTLHQTSRLGLVMVEWDVSGQDWRRPGVDRIVRNVLTKTHNGSIILLHDGDTSRRGGDRSQTVAALPKLIESLRAEGYQFVTVPELLKLQNVH